jgi:iron complex outermembrane receptor protein
MATRMFKTAAALTLALTVCPRGALPAHAQRAGENPVTAAEDAFGTSVGGESIGLYHSGNVRGFSPLAAGNVRLEGLYFERQGEFTSRLVAGSVIRVGLSALGDPFPAPTGIVDYRLRRPGEARVASVVAQANSYGGTQLEVDAQVPLAAGRLGVAGGAGVYGNRYPDGGDAFVSSAALVSRWRPVDGVEVLPFFSRIDVHDRKVAPAILVGGDHLPPEIPRRRFFGQPWAGYDAVRTNYGALGSARTGAWTLRAGLFRSVEEPTRSFSTLFLDTSSEGAADLVVVANPPQRFASSSGEVRLSRSFGAGTRRHTLDLSVRGREQARRYGGSHRAELGRARIGGAAPTPEPEFRFGPQSRDHIRQWTTSLAYEGRWRGTGEMRLGVQRADYRKAVSLPAGAVPPSRDDPWLYNGALALHLRPSVALYGGYTRGLEESPVAPETAVNRDEAPPAIRTEQVDLGLRWRAGRGMRVVAGVFRVDKPYHAQDTARVFRRLGQVRHQGVEVSVSGELLPGLNVVAGAVPLEARVSGEQVDAGLIGARPVGSSGRTLLANVDYRPPRLSALSLDLAVQGTGRRVANAANTLHVPAATLVDVGARYRFTLGGNPAVVRVAATNLFDAYTWDVTGGGAFSYNPPRQVSVRATVDL